MQANWWSLFVLPGELFMPGFDAVWVSAGFWLLAVCAACYAVGFVQDAVDPTYRQERREARQALARARRRVNAIGHPVRIEPTWKQ